MQMEIFKADATLHGLGEKGMSGDPLSLADGCKMIEVPEQVKLMSRGGMGELPLEVLGGFSNVEAVQPCAEAP